MSNPDSFIDEVTQEMRRDQMFALLRRYGWIGVVVVLGIVGGTAWNEYRNAQADAAAQAAGDALMAALAADDPAARAAAMAAVQLDGNAAAVGALLQAATLAEAGDTATAATSLAQVTGQAALDPMYRDIAAFKAAMAPQGDAAARRAALEGLAQAGQPLRLLALEQLAYLALTGGDDAAALALLAQIDEDAAVTRATRERVQTVMIALGDDSAAALQ